eukprot:5039473-Amphidinium_carterae.1
MVNHGIVLPHELFGTLWKEGKAQFFDFWLGTVEGDEELKRFWKKMENTELASRVEELEELKKENPIPLKLFGDGVA